MGLRSHLLSALFIIAIVVLYFLRILLFADFISSESFVIIWISRSPWARILQYGLLCFLEGVLLKQFIKQPINALRKHILLVYVLIFYIVHCFLTVTGFVLTLFHSPFSMLVFHTVAITGNAMIILLITQAIRSFIKSPQNREALSDHFRLI